MSRKNKEGVELFSGSSSRHEPLASRLRPLTLDEFSGQEHIVGPGRLLRRAIKADQLSSLILSGPPGTGKTTLARVIANLTASRFITLNAVLSGVQEIRNAIEEARTERDLHDRKTILFVDEVHRWNKAQQDALLPWVENGTVILVGATTENPFFEVNKALVSRSRVFELVPLLDRDLESVYLRALSDKDRGYGKFDVRVTEEAREHLIHAASGDARTLLNALELAVETSVDSWPPPEGTRVDVDLPAAEESIRKRAILYDKDGDCHYDTISAFIKSIRGSDPDAALYWLARMVRAGEDPDFIFRRLTVSACEDIGLAEPNAITVVSSCATSFSRVGYPEGNYLLAHAALYLATCPKSDSSSGFFRALDAVEREDADVPNHLKDPSRDAEGSGHGKDYKYPHAYEGNWVAQTYLPRSLRDEIFYEPSGNGFEKSIREAVRDRREAVLSISQDGKETEGHLTYDGGGKARDGFLKRLSGRSAKASLDARDALVSLLPVRRHSTVLVAEPDTNPLFWEIARRTPEGLCAGIFRSCRAFDSHAGYAASMEETTRPVLVRAPVFPAERGFGPDALAELLSSLVSSCGTCAFDIACGVDFARRWGGPGKAIASLARFVSQDGILAFSEAIPALGTRLSSILLRFDAGSTLAEALGKTEETFWESDGNPLASHTTQGFLQELEANGFCIKERHEDRITFPRLVTVREIDAWTDPGSSVFANAVSADSGDAFLRAVRDALKGIADSCGGKGIEWETTRLRVVAAKPGRPAP